MDELKSRFDAATKDIAAPPADVDLVMRRGRRDRVWRGVAAVGTTCLVVAAGVFGAVTVFSNDIEIAGGDDGYVFTFEILGYDEAQNHVQLRYTSEWASDEPPGVRDCTWYLYREDGSFISDWEYNIGAQPRRVSRTTEITAPELPDHIETSCGPRQDHGRYVLTSGPVVEKRRLGTVQEWVLAFDLTWEGSRVRGQTECHWQIYSRDGTTVMKRGVQGVGGGEGPDVPEIVVRLTRGFNNPPGDAEVNCVPFGENPQAPEPDAEPSSARFATRYPATQRNPQEVVGVVEIDAEAGTICSTAYLPWARAAQIHMKAPPDDEFPIDGVFITIFDPPAEFQASICTEADPAKLSQVLSDPDGFYIDYHEKDSGGMEARSELEPMDQEASGFMLFGEQGAAEPFVSVAPNGGVVSICAGGLPAETSSVDLIDEEAGEALVTWDDDFVDGQGKRFVCTQAVDIDVASLSQEPLRYSLRAQVGSEVETFELLRASASGEEIAVTATPDGGPYEVEFETD